MIFLKNTNQMKLLYLVRDLHLQVMVKPIQWLLRLLAGRRIGMGILN
jgi:hypothetical protein